MCELEDKRYLGSEMIVSRPKSARRAWPAPSISILALAGKIGKMEATLAIETHPFKIAVDHSLTMDVD